MADKCTLCHRNPDNANNWINECAHVECPHRRKAWSDGTRRDWEPLQDGRVSKPFDDMFDKE